MKKILPFIFFLSICSPLFSQSCKEIKKEVIEFRAEYKADFLEEERSPFYGHPEKLDHLKFYKSSKKYRVQATFTRTTDAKTFDMATYSGMVKPYVKYGTLQFSIKGQSHQIAVYQSLRLREMEEYQDYLFIPFKDLTNGDATYGGGRYIDLRMKDIQDDKVLLNFNKAYNPWCAFSDGYNCPVPPVENHLSIAIKAGERNYGKVVEH